MDFIKLDTQIAPPTIVQNVMQSFSAGANQLAAQSVRSAGAFFSIKVSPLLATSAVCVAAVVGGGMWLTVRQPKVAATAQTAVAHQTPSPIEPSPRELGFVKEWNFNDGKLPPEFKLLQGDYKILPSSGVDKSACIEFSNQSLVIIDVNAEDIPLSATISAFPYGIQEKDTASGTSISMFWSNFRFAMFFFNLGKMHPQSSGWRVFKYQITDDGAVTWVDDLFSRFDAYEREPGSKLVIAFVSRHRIDNLKIQKMSAQEELFDVRKWLEAAREIEPTQRVGKVALPQYQSLRPPEPVYVQFVKAVNLLENKRSP